MRAGAPEKQRCIEAQVMDLSDDIAYSVHDFEDAIVGGYLDVPALGARVNHDELVDSMFEWIGGEFSHDELIAAFDRLDNLDYWIDSWSGSRVDLARLKNLTSQLIGRFAHEAVHATREPLSHGQSCALRCRRRGSAETRAEIAVLKGIVAANVMSTNVRKPIYVAAAQHPDASSRTCSVTAVRSGSMRVSRTTGRTPQTTQCASASSSTRSPRSPTSPRWRGTSGSCAPAADSATSSRFRKFRKRATAIRGGAAQLPAVTRKVCQRATLRVARFLNFRKREGGGAGAAARLRWRARAGSPPRA